jgi:flavin reductase (DIM6/NTAB) family NADH-FMN oxidoreductase RutF
MKSEIKEISWDEAITLGSPYNYTLAVTVDKKNKPNIIGLAWWTFVCWEPKMVVISIGKERYSHECIEHCKEFVLCFPSKEQKQGAWFCGEKSGRDVDKLKETGFKTVPSKIVKPPIIDGSTVAYECKVVDKLHAGDHTIYVANIVAIYGTPEKPSHLYSIHYEKLIDISFNEKKS